jgi:hypothetical protein
VGGGTISASIRSRPSRHADAVPTEILHATAAAVRRVRARRRHQPVRAEDSTCTTGEGLCGDSGDLLARYGGVQPTIAGLREDDPRDGNHAGISVS